MYSITVSYGCFGVDMVVVFKIAVVVLVSIVLFEILGLHPIQCPRGVLTFGKDFP